jgi:hypothetical protein
MPFCRQCGTEYSNTDVYCNKCGGKLAGEQQKTQNKNLSYPNVKNTIIWLVAFMPLIGLVIENTCAIAFDTSIGNLWWITLIVNIVLCVIDQERIKKAYPNLAIMKAWIFLTPVYLFKRARALKQSLAYFIVWIVMFCLIAFIPQSFILNNPIFNFGLGSSQTIEMVKEGTFNDYSGMSVGEAIDKYLSDEEWTSFNSDTGEQIVQVEGNTSYYEGHSYSILIQFIVNSDSSFNMSYLSVDGQPQSVNYYNYFLDVIYGEYNEQSP